VAAHPPHPSLCTPHPLRRRGHRPGAPPGHHHSPPSPPQLPAVQSSGMRQCVWRPGGCAMAAKIEINRRISCAPPHGGLTVAAHPSRRAIPPPGNKFRWCPCPFQFALANFRYMKVYLVPLTSSNVPTRQVFKQTTNFTFQVGIDLFQWRPVA
jgi:hypothetical protein